jgi:hypothetical protein
MVMTQMEGHVIVMTGQKYIHMVQRTVNDSVAEPIHFCATSAPACKKFRLQLRPFSSYILEKKIKHFRGYRQFSCFLKNINGHQKFLLSQ